MKKEKRPLRAGTLIPAIEGELNGNETCRKPLRQRLPSEARLTLQRFGNRETFLKTFRFEQLSVHTAPENLQRCFMGTAPSLVNVDNAFGEGTICEWLVYLLTGISQLCGAMTKLDNFQYRTTALLIRRYYFDLKVTELEVFFSRLAAGCYGKISYGAVDPQAIMVALRQFRRERNDIVDFYQREEDRRRREAALSSPTIMTRDEYDEYCIRRPFLQWICLACHPDMPAFHVDEDWREVKERRRKLENERRRKLENEKIKELENEERRKLENKEIRECHPEFFFMMNLPLEMIFWMLDVFCQCVRIATYVPEGDKADDVVIYAMKKLAKLVLPQNEEEMNDDYGNS